MSRSRIIWSGVVLAVAASSLVYFRFFYIPHVSLDLLFSRHLMASDLPAGLLKERVGQTDIFLMEWPAWGDEIENDVNAISQGSLTPDGYFKKRGISGEQVQQYFPFFEFQLKTLYQSGIFVTSVDLPASNPLSADIQDMLPLVNQTEVSTHFDETLWRTREKWQKLADLEIQREEYIITHYEELVTRIREEQVSQVKGKSNIRILFLVGPNHAGLYDMLRMQKMDVHEEFSPTPYHYNYAGDITLALLAKKTVSDDLFAQLILEDLFSFAFGGAWVDDEQKAARFFKNTISRFTFDEIKDVYIATVTATNPLAAFIEKLMPLAQEKGLTIPMTKKEFDALNI